MQVCFSQIFSESHGLFRFGNRGRGFDVDEEMHYPTRPVDKEKAEHELVINIKKATSAEETAPKQKHVRSTLRTSKMLYVN